MKKLFFTFFCLAIMFFGANVAEAELLENYDLRIQEITVSPATPKVDETCKIKVVIKNNSAEPLTDNEFTEYYKASFIGFSIDSIDISDMSVSDPIEVGSNYSYEFTGSFASKGTKSLTFEIDPEEHLIGLYPQHTGKTTYVEVDPADDLALVSVEFIPETPVVNQKMYIKVGIENTGRESYMDLEAIRSIDYNLPNFEHTVVESPDINVSDWFEPGEIEYYKYEGNFTKQGDFSGYYIVDAVNRLDEFDEENNREDFEFTVTNPHDVNISFVDFEYSKEDIVKGEDIEIIFNFKNTGTVSLTNNQLLGSFDFDIENFLKTRQASDEMPTPSDPLEEDEYFSYKVFGSFTAEGDNNVSVSLNRYEEYIESDYEDNASTTSVYIYKDQTELDFFEITSHGVSFDNSTKARISWKTTKETLDEVTVGKNQYASGMVSQEVESSDDEHELIFEDLESGVTYYYNISAIRNDEEKTTGYISFRTPDSDDINKVGDLSVSKNLDQGIAIIKWQTNMLCKGGIEYWQKYYEGSADIYWVGESELIDSHSLILSELISDEEYEFNLVCSDDNENEVYRSGDMSFVLGETNSVSENVVDEIENDHHNQSQAQTQNQTQSGEQVQAQGREQVSYRITNQGMYGSLQGKIILTVETNGEAYYVAPDTDYMYFMGRPDDAFGLMRSHGVGISNIDLEKIPIGTNGLGGKDTDGDGLPDLFEDGIGTDKYDIDSDGDTYSDMVELENGFDPRKVKGRKMNYDNDFANKQKGKIFIQVEGAGEAWYVNPEDGKRYFLGRPADAFSIMRTLGLGISNENFQKMQ